MQTPASAARRRFTGPHHVSFKTRRPPGVTDPDSPGTPAFRIENIGALGRTPLLSLTLLRACAERRRRRVPLFPHVGAHRPWGDHCCGCAATRDRRCGIKQVVRSNGRGGRNRIEANRSIVDRVATDARGEAAQFHSGSRVGHNGIVVDRGPTGAEKDAVARAGYLVARC